MIKSERDIPTPTTFISPSELRTCSPYFQTFDNFFNLLQVIGSYTYYSEHHPSLRPQFEPHIPLKTPNSHPVYSPFAILYELTSGIITGQVPVDQQAITEDSQLQPDVTEGLVKLMDSIHLAYMGQITWNSPRSFINERSHLELQVFSKDNVPHRRATFNTNRGNLQFSWFAYNTARLPNQEARDYSLVAGVRTRFHFVDDDRFTMLFKTSLDVQRVPWVMDGGQYKAGRGVNILSRLLGIEYAERVIAEARMPDCYWLQGGLIHALKLNKEFPPPSKN